MRIASLVVFAVSFFHTGFRPGLFFLTGIAMGRINPLQSSVLQIILNRVNFLPPNSSVHHCTHSETEPCT